MEKGPLVSIILPALNERENLKSLLPEISNILTDYNFEIIVVDDASIDGTKHLLSDFDITYLYNIKKIGLGKSIQMGIKKAQGEIIIVMDSDGDHSITCLPLMIDDLDSYDIVTSSRFTKGSRIKNGPRPYLSKVYNRFIRIMTGGKLTDYLYGHWSIKKSTLDKLKSKNIFYGHGDYCIRLFYYFEKGDFDFYQIPAIVGKRKFGKSNFGPVKIFIKYSLAVFKLTLKERVLSVPKNKKMQNLPKS